MMYRSRSKSVNSSSELVRCNTQIKLICLSIFLFIIGLIIFMTIPMDELKKLTDKLQMMQTSTTQQQQPILLSSILLPETINKFIAIGILSSISVIIFVLAIIMATQKSCYKTSIFSILFGLLFGIF